MEPVILYEDQDILAVHKPAGLSTQTSRIGAPDCVSALKILLHERDGISDPYLGVIHRLDQSVEGIILFAKNREAAAVLSKDLQSERMVKEYRVASKSGEVIEQRPHRLIDYILTDRILNMSRIAEAGEKNAKRAELFYEPVKSYIENGYPGEPFRVHILKVLLKTGRHHQIRVQLSHAALPVIGDSKYGFVPGGYEGPLCLKAVRLAIRHPVSRQEMEFSIDPGMMGER
ncbi:MAG: RluA family pseudouridine synthase [Lachnospiraceae bacterium]|nr:RluA family pseudouridine synthase [Lachnospiraceae bacterium]